MEKLLLMLMLSFLIMSPLLATEQSTDLKKRLALGETYREKGDYSSANTEFAAVLAQAKQQNNPLIQAMAAAASGYTYYLARDNANALILLEQSRVLATTLNKPALLALIEHYLGDLYIASASPDKAEFSLASALKNAQLAKQDDLVLSIRINQAKLPVNEANRFTLLENISADLVKVTNPTLKIKLLLAISEQQLSMIADDLAKTSAQQLQSTAQHLNNAYQLADTHAQIRLRSQAAGYLSRLDALQNRFQSALSWLDKATFDAQQINATDLLMQWEIQRGQLLHRQGNIIAATKAYQRAVKHLVAIRYSLPITLHDGRSSIKTIIDPIYRGLADVLLLQAAQATSSEVKQSLLKQAIAAMETIKQTDLEDFFNDRCIIDKADSTNLEDAKFTSIGILYPVIFPDRIELLFRAGDGSQFEQKSVLVSSGKVLKTITEMSQYLRTSTANDHSSLHELYNWLLKPYDDTLKAKGITTLVYVPDSELRAVPFAALLNKKRFVVEDYAVVTLPSLTLKKIVADYDKKPHALIAALAKPDGASIDELLQSASSGVFGERGLISGKNKVDKSMRSALVEQLSLPGVNSEILALQKDMSNTTLLNQAFTYEDFKQSVGTGDYSIIHIASHGFFGKNIKDSFIMTYDRNLKMDEFQSLLNSDVIKKAPIDLLTLSACQTAEGDDHALLGFSGMAIKSNALSAVGTLWDVDDAGTATFMEDFYANLNKFSKSEALRQAQLSLINSKNLKHPYYWSPFILVGNW